MKTKELRKLNDQDLQNKLKEISHEHMKERAQIAVGTIPKSPGKMKLMRKVVARINTILHQRENKK